MRGNRISILLLAGSLILVSSLTMLASASVISEHEPNDTIFEAEVIGEGMFSGEVSFGSSFGIGTKRDNDTFIVSVPARKMLKITIEREKANGFAVFVSAYDEDLERLDNFFLIGQPNGERMEEEWYNSADRSSKIYLNLSGEGKYLMTIQFENNFSLGLLSSLSWYSLIVLLFGVMIGFILGILAGEREQKKKERYMEIWKKKREMGKWKFTLIYGVVFWGLLTTFTITIVHMIFSPSRPMLWVLLEFIFYLVAFSIGGVIFGLVTWRSNEKRFLKWVEKDDVFDRIRPIRKNNNRPRSSSSMKREDHMERFKF